MKFRLLKREMVLSPNDEDSEDVASSKNNIPNSRLECACTSHTLFQTKMVEIDTLVFQTIPWVPDALLARFPVSGRRRVGLRPTPKLPAAREKNLWYLGYSDQNG